MILQVNNVIPEEKRISLLNFLKPLHKNLGENFPKLQTTPDLHHLSEMDFFILKVKDILFDYHPKHSPCHILKCWGNWTDGTYLNWHNHPESVFSIVYYLKNEDKIGTAFRNNEKESQRKRPENSLVIFPSDIPHSVPQTSQIIDRYSIAIEIT